MGKNVLVVDDSASMRQMVKFTLSGEGFDIVEAGNGKEAIEKIDGISDLSLIVSDIHMPEMNGIELVKNLRGNAKYKFTPIIILTTESEQAMQEEGKSAGASAWIVKPFTPDKLKDIVKKVLGMF